MTRELEEMEDQMAEMQRKYSSQKREYDEIVSSKDDVGKSVHDLEKVRRSFFDICCCILCDIKLCLFYKMLA